MNTMTPSKPVTDGQIGKFNELFWARLRKSGMQSEATQQVLAEEGDAVAEEMVAVVRRRVERRSEMIVRPFKLDRTKGPEQMIAALDRKHYVDNDVLATMPIEGKDEGDLYFFPGKRTIPAKELALEYETRGLVPHPLAQMQVNIDDKSFADEHPNGMQWIDGDGNVCYATFRRWGGGRGVSVDRHGSGWSGRWWFAGVRK